LRTYPFSCRALRLARTGFRYTRHGSDPQLGLPMFDQWLQRIHPEDREELKLANERTFLNKVNCDVEFRIVKPDGTVKHIHGIGHPVLGHTGELVQVVGTMVDITERKRVEEAREKLRQLEADLAHTNRVSTLGEMAASLAHEIKQPIAAAITSANSCMEWLAHEPSNLDRARAAAARIDKYGNRAAEIIERIRSFYKKSPPERELVDVNGIIQEMLTLLNGEAHRYPIAMRAELAAELPKITADRVQLQQVFMNLMLNAIEAMKDSGGELTVKSELQDGQLQFSVSDTGVGLPREDVDQIFSAFFTCGSPIHNATSVAAMPTHCQRWTVGFPSNNLPGSRLPLDTVLHRRRLWREREGGMQALTAFRLRDRIDGANRRFWGEKPRARNRVHC
jgi:signal transduction histidine kinase